MISSMKKKVLAAFVLGAWTGGTIFMWMVAMKNFQVVDAVLGAPPDAFRDTASALSADNLRLVMRYQASEVNRLFFDGWGMVQIVLAAAFLWPAWRLGGRFLPAAAVLLLVTSLVLQFYVVPETIRLGRIIDFLPRDPAPPESVPFWRLHNAYTGLDMVKFFVILASLGAVLRRREEVAEP